MWLEIFTALALLLILEGIFPFLSPTAFRQAMMAMAQQHEKTLRMGGLGSMVVGVVLLYIIR